LLRNLRALALYLKLYLLKWSSFNAEELFFFILKLIRVRIYHFQISFCLLITFVILNFSALRY